MIDELALLKGTVVEIEVSFKIQVQKWKNILLRDHNQKDLEKYRAKFFEREKAVDTAAASLIASTDNAGIKKQLENFLEEHKRLGESYRSGLDMYQNGTEKLPYQSDASVRGKDRAPAQIVNELSTTLFGELDTMPDVQSKNRAIDHRNVLICIVSVFVVLAVFVYWMTNRIATKPLGKTLRSA